MDGSITVRALRPVAKTGKTKPHMSSDFVQRIMALRYGQIPNSVLSVLWRKRPKGANSTVSNPDLVPPRLGTALSNWIFSPQPGSGAAQFGPLFAHANQSWGY
jgi:hypothetical protein